MIKAIKNFLKRILPPPVKSFMREINGLRELIVAQCKGLFDGQRKLLERTAELQLRQNEMSTKMLDAFGQQKLDQEKMIHDLAFQRRFILKLVDAINLQGRDLAALSEQVERCRASLAAALDAVEQGINCELAEQRTALQETRMALAAALDEAEQELVSGQTERLRMMQEELVSGQTERLHAMHEELVSGQTERLHAMREELVSGQTERLRMMQEELASGQTERLRTMQEELVSGQSERLYTMQEEHRHIGEKVSSAVEKMQQGMISKLDELESHGMDAFGHLTEGQKCALTDIRILSADNSALRELICGQGEKLAKSQEKQMRWMESERKALSGEVEKVRLQAQEGKRNAAEAMWAEIFNSTIFGSTWLKNTAFSPGRWAIGYQNLYVMYRVLNEAKPKRILELGLGQSSRMLSQYVDAHDNTEHTIVEDNPDWIDFFKKDFQLSARSRIMQFDCELIPYKDAEAVRVYEGFSQAFEGQKFDFISIDAPWSGDMKKYARIDILRMLPVCLSENFVILFDDCERSGETQTLKEMENRLKEAGVAYKRGRYSGKKDCVLLCAEHMGFLATM